MGDNGKRMRSGIYVIENLENGKIYIGSAIYIKSRFSCHKYHLRKGSHHSKYLQRSWDKYGEAAFSFLVIEECEKNKEMLLSREQFYIDHLKPEYNGSPTARSCLGIKGTPESNLKKSLNHKTKGKYGKDHPSSKKIYQYSLDGSLVKEWHGADEIQRATGYSAANIRKGTQDDVWTPYGFYWRYSFLGDKIEPRKKRDRIRTCKKIGMFDADENLVKEFISQSEAVKYLGISSNSAINIILKKHPKHKTAYGYIWKYL